MSGHRESQLPGAEATLRVGAQPCPTLCDPMDRSPPGSSVHAILQARILGWVASSSSRGSSQPGNGNCISCVSFFGRGILYHWATWEAQYLWLPKGKHGEEGKSGTRDENAHSTIYKIDNHKIILYIIRNAIQCSLTIYKRKESKK